jgi:hypothetical protein
MVTCTRCKTLKLPDCKAAENSDVCGSCLRAGNYSCDAFGNDDSAVRRLVDQERNLDEKERAATEAIRAANRALGELDEKERAALDEIRSARSDASRALMTALEKADRLRTQRLALKQKALAMFEQEREVFVEQERREVATGQPSSSGVAGVPSFDFPWVQKFVFFTPLLASLLTVLSFSSDDPFLAGADLSVGLPLVGPDSSGGTPEVSRGS